MFFNLLDMCMSNAYVVYTHQCMPDISMSRKKCILHVIAGLEPPSTANPIPRPKQATSGPDHKLKRLSGKNRRTWHHCEPKRLTSFWCPGCTRSVSTNWYIFGDLMGSLASPKTETQTDDARIFDFFHVNNFLMYIIFSIHTYILNNVSL